ncbi:MAG: glutamine-hydrolyzing GMP synthase [Oscillospiraceae bacterium]|jgi:GMP synthase (glutamine-hydrolysing)|nr:glutamine-hydrolyzing GMP synthase [Oscillospiraceae bacterium]
MKETENRLVLVLDFGGQYKELIARRVRECRVASVIKPGRTPLDEIKKLAPIGIILTGGPDSVYKPGAPKAAAELFELGIPVLGICYGMHLMAHTLGGSVEPALVSEYGRIDTEIDTKSQIFAGLDSPQICLMSHTDQVTRLPEGFKTAARTADCETAAMADEKRGLYATQFHPEVENTPRGTAMIRNFLYGVCRAEGDYDLGGYRARMIEEIRGQVGERRVLLGLSGGVDSSVCAALLAEALPGRLYCIFVDHGLMRLGEGDEVEAAFRGRKLHFLRVDAGARFLKKLRGVRDPERKRRIIGEEFVRVFEDEAKKLGGADFLAQGTIYPDVVESGANASATIKSHHNVGGLPEDMAFRGIVEPLRGLFKDEVRKLGRELGLPRALTERQPFPGPGLAVRVMGAVTKEKLDTLRLADAIFREEVSRLRSRPDQYFAVLTDTRSVGVMGDFRTYGCTVALRAVKTTDFMTCEYVPLPHRMLGRVSARIVNEVRGVSRVVYDITGKPPGTIEWE